MAKSKRPTKAQAAKIAAIRAKNYSPTYEKRLVRGILKNKTIQQARGHRPGEARQRREYQRRQNEGLTTNEIKSIREWYKSFERYWKPNGDGGLKDDIPDVEEIIVFSREQGYSHFKNYRKIWLRARNSYVREVKSGTWKNREMPYLGLLTSMAGVRSHGNEQWLYYH